VIALKDGVEISSPVPPAPEAKFKVLEQTRAEEVNLAKKSYPNSHLILGAVYKKAGLLDDAEREFKGLLSANPNSPVAQKLLQNVKSLRRK
jgi:lipopolysaccharide biosynthesis regulator YciM